MGSVNTGHNGKRRNSLADSSAYSVEIPGTDNSPDYKSERYNPSFATGTASQSTAGKVREGTGSLPSDQPYVIFILPISVRIHSDC